MKRYVEEILHATIRSEPARLSLPLYLKGLFRLEAWEALGARFLVAYPQESVGVNALSKHAAKLQGLAGCPVAFAFDDASSYRIGRMTEEGIPFVVRNRLVYLPFLGTVLSSRQTGKDERLAGEVDKVSIQAQRLVLMSLYEGWEGINATQAASALGVTRMTLTRAFDELESLRPGWIERKGKTRRFVPPASGEQLWKEISPHLFNPVVREHWMAGGFEREGLPLSGVSALSGYTMIGDNPYPTLAVTKRQEKEWGLKRRAIPTGEDAPGCVLQVTRYPLGSMEKGARRIIDPLSAVLSLSDEQKEDPRIEGETDNLLKRVFSHEFKGIGSI